MDRIAREKDLVANRDTDVLLPKIDTVSTKKHTSRISIPRIHTALFERAGGAHLAG
jgi:hypothetical protein